MELLINATNYLFLALLMVSIGCHICEDAAEIWKVRKK